MVGRMDDSHGREGVDEMRGHTGGDPRGTLEGDVW